MSSIFVSIFVGSSTKATFDTISTSSVFIFDMFLYLAHEHCFVGSTESAFVFRLASGCIEMAENMLHVRCLEREQICKEVLFWDTEVREKLGVAHFKMGHRNRKLGLLRGFSLNECLVVMSSYNSYYKENSWLVLWVHVQWSNVVPHFVFVLRCTGKACIAIHLLIHRWIVLSMLHRWLFANVGSDLQDGLRACQTPYLGR